MNNVDRLPNAPDTPRQRFIHRTRHIWIDGLLHHTIGHGIYLTLHKTYLPSEEPISTDTSILNIFEKNGRSLLILGAPASGKTTTLLQLAQSLLDLAQQDANRPIPSILNLSSWASQQLPLSEWIVEELFIQQQTARSLSRQWLQNKQLTLLLDGLDEVVLSAREACIAAINQFQAEHSADIVVCGHRDDYQKLQVRLTLSATICLQPLTQAQIEEYLARFGPTHTSLYDTMIQDPDLQQLAQSPLMLNLMALAHSGQAFKLSPNTTVADKQRQLLSLYSERAFGRRPLTGTALYDQNKARQWLTNLAHSLEQHNQAIFYIERLQPTWLPHRRFYYWPYRLLAGLLFGLRFGLFLGIFGGLSSGLMGGLIFALLGALSGERFGGLSFDTTGWLNFGLLGGASGGLILGLLGGLLLALGGGMLGGLSWGLSHNRFLSHLGRLGEVRSGRRIWDDWLLFGSVIGAVSGLIGGLIGWLILELPGILGPEWPNEMVAELIGEPGNILIFGLGIGLILGFFGGLFGGIFDSRLKGKVVRSTVHLASKVYRRLLHFQQRKIEVVEDITWHWPTAATWWQGVRNGTLNWLRGGIILGIIYGLGRGVISGLLLGPILSIFLGLNSGLVFGLFGGLFGGLQTFVEPNQNVQLLRPNQGITTAYRTVVRAGIPFALIGSLFGYCAGSLMMPVFNDLLESEINWAVIGLSLGLLGPLSYGGVSLWRHYLLRLQLTRQGVLPFSTSDHQLIAFLDDMVDHLLLYRVGGGWIFIHRTLQEIFASKHPQAGQPLPATPDLPEFDP
jgi:hypothetical protein